MKDTIFCYRSSDGSETVHALDNFIAKRISHKGYLVCINPDVLEEFSIYFRERRINFPEDLVIVRTKKSELERLRYLCFGGKLKEAREFVADFSHYLLTRVLENEI